MNHQHGRTLNSPSQGRDWGLQLLQQETGREFAKPFFCLHDIELTDAAFTVVKLTFYMIPNIAVFQSSEKDTKW